MIFKIVIIKSAEKEIKKLLKNDLFEIKQSIDVLRESPYPAGCVKIQGYKKDLYRIKTSSKRFRIIYAVDKTNDVIEILRVALRKDVYRHLADLVRKVN
jgi:mRNA interferase RelE/StbE